MKKKIFCWIFIIFAIFNLVSCDKVNKKSTKGINQDRVLKKYKSIKNYKSDIELQVINEKQTRDFKFKQKCIKGKKYEIKFENNMVMKFKSKDFKNKKTRNKIENKEKPNDNIYKLTFIENYVDFLYTNKDIKYYNKESENKKFLLYSMPLSGNNRNLNTACVSINAENGYPHKIIIYDNNLKERVIIRYKKFSKIS